MFLFRRVALHKYDPPDLVTTTSTPAAGLSQPCTNENQTPIRCVSTGKEQLHDTSTFSPTMDDTTLTSIQSSSPHSAWFDDNANGNHDKAARNLDFDDMLDLDADDVLDANDHGDSDDDLI